MLIEQIFRLWRVLNLIMHTKRAKWNLRIERIFVNDLQLYGGAPKNLTTIIIYI